MTKSFVYNPHNVSEDSLPTLYGVVLTLFASDIGVTVMDKEGKYIYQHISSDEHFAKIDIGFTIGSKFDQSLYMRFYPDGYKTEFVSFREVDKHPVIGPLFAAKPNNKPDEDNLIKLIDLLDKNHQFHCTDGITRFMLRGLGSVDSNDLRAIADEVDLRNGVVKQT